MERVGERARVGGNKIEEKMKNTKEHAKLVLNVERKKDITSA